MSAPRYVAADVSGKGYLLRLDDLGSYGAVASGSINTMRGLADELCPPAPVREIPPMPDRAPTGGEEAREVQLDALVIPADSDRHPELHADRRPDSYGDLSGLGQMLGFKPNPDADRLELDRQARQARADARRGSNEL